MCLKTDWLSEQQIINTLRYITSIAPCLHSPTQFETFGRHCNSWRTHHPFRGERRNQEKRHCTDTILVDMQSLFFSKYELCIMSKINEVSNVEQWTLWLWISHDYVMHDTLLQMSDIFGIGMNSGSSSGDIVTANSRYWEIECLTHQCRVWSTEMVTRG